VVLALIVVGPLLLPGFTLAYDMVFVPHPHWSSALLGIAPTYPRAVPTQLLVTAVSTAVPAEVVQKAVLLLAFAGAATGAARLIEGAPAAARIAAGVLYAWNPMTYERLLLGQWAVLLGYAVLPWAVAAALAYRRRRHGSAARLILAVAALTAATPYLAIVGGAAVLVIALWPPPDRDPVVPRPAPDPRPTLLVLAGIVGVSLVWLVPTLLHPGVHDDAVLPVDLFGARADAPVGTLGSLLSLGGVWRTDLAPPGRATLVWLPAFALIVAVAGLGWRGLGLAWGRGARRGLVVAATTGLAVAIAPRVAGAHAVVVWIVRTVPGGGFLRDSQKFVIPLALAEAVAFGFGVRRLLERVRVDDRLLRRAALALAVLPVALAPTLAWGAGGRLHTAAYPPSWAAVDRVTSRDPVPGGILILPWHAYLSFGWNHGQTVHQPAPLYFGRPMLAATSLEFGNATLPGEDPWSRMADRAVLGPQPLAPDLPRLGVRYVLVFKEGAWRPLLPKVAGLARVIDAPDLTLYRGDFAGPVPSFPTPPAPAVVAGDVVALGVVLAAAAVAAGSRRRRGGVGHP
jgi:hypothetical protein